MKVFILVAFLTFLAIVNAQELQYTKPPDLSCVLDSYSGAKNQAVRISDSAAGNFTISTPPSQGTTTTAIGTNIPMPSKCVNNAELEKFFGISSSNPGLASLMAHFNCKGHGETCKSYTFDTPVSGMCLMVANVDGYDKVTFQSSLGGVQNDPTHWNKLNSGNFNTNGSSCPPMEQRIVGNTTQLGCFEQQCDNPNYAIYQLKDQTDNVTFCYTSYSDSEVVYYALTPCKESIPPTPLPFPVYAMSGYAFTDTNNNGLYETGTDTPNSGIKVSLLDPATGELALDGYGVPIQPVFSNRAGYYVFNILRANQYEVKFDYPETATATIQPNPNTSTTPKSNKMGSDFKTIRITVVNSTTQDAQPGEADSTSGVKKIIRDINGGIQR